MLRVVYKQPLRSASGRAAAFGTNGADHDVQFALGTLHAKSPVFWTLWGRGVKRVFSRCDTLSESDHFICDTFCERDQRFQCAR